MLAVLATRCCIVHADELTAESACDALTARLANTLKASIPDVGIDEYRNNSEDLAVISELHSDSHSYIGGITTASPLVEYEVEPNLALLPGKQGVCARPSISVVMGYSAISVLMNIEIPRNSCLYNSVFAHEMHHVDIYRHYINRNLDTFKSSVDAKFNGKSYLFNSIFEAKQYTEILGQVFAQHLKEKFMSEVNAEQKALDTQTEYARIQLECSSPRAHPF